MRMRKLLASGLLTGALFTGGALGPNAASAAPGNVEAVASQPLAYVYVTSFPTFDQCAANAQSYLNSIGLGGYSWFCQFGYDPAELYILV
jgi:hypothetical protein